MTDMPSRSKSRSPGNARRSSRPPSEAHGPTAKPFLRFYHSAGLRQKTLSVLSALERAQDATGHREALADIVVELTNSGMDYYFMKPLKLVRAAFIVEQSANLGLVGEVRLDWRVASSARPGPFCFQPGGRTRAQESGSKRCAVPLLGQPTNLVKRSLRATFSARHRNCAPESGPPRMPQKGHHRSTAGGRFGAAKGAV
jgi:hypothetical protein